MSDDKTSSTSLLNSNDELSAQIFGKFFVPSKDEFFKTAKEIDFKDVLEPSTTITLHYNYKELVMNDYNGFGYVASKNHLVLDDSDIVVASFPKSGTTWLQEIVYNICNKNDIDIALKEVIDIRIPCIDCPECGFESMISRPSPRIIKTHLPYEFLTDIRNAHKCKIIYIARNPKDTAVSLYHFLRMVDIYQFHGTLKEVVNMFLNNKAIYCPYGKHVLSYWNRREQENILFLKYEDLIKDVHLVIQQIANFLNVKVDDILIAKIAEKCNFQNMSKNPFSNHSQWLYSDSPQENSQFLRKGKVGDWKNHFDEEISSQFDDWIEKIFAGSDLKFQYEI